MNFRVRYAANWTYLDGFSGVDARIWSDIDAEDFENVVLSLVDVGPGCDLAFSGALRLINNLFQVQFQSVTHQRIRRDPDLQLGVILLILVGEFDHLAPTNKAKVN